MVYTIDIIIYGGYTMISISEKLKILLGRRGMSQTKLADLTDQSYQNLSGKMAKDNFKVSELIKYADKLNCDVEVTFTMRDTGEKI